MGNFQLRITHHALFFIIKWFHILAHLLTHVGTLTHKNGAVYRQNRSIPQSEQKPSFLNPPAKGGKTIPIYRDLSGGSLGFSN